MGCNCSNNQSSTSFFSGQVSGDCTYDYVTVTNWKSILDCLKNTNQYTKLGLELKDMNIFLGNVISALNNGICSFSSQLDQIKPYIISTVNLGICQT